MTQRRVAGWQGLKEEAEGFFQAVPDRNPGEVDALTGMGDLARDRRQLAEARGFYERSLTRGDTPKLRQRLDQLAASNVMRWDAGFSFSTFKGSGRSDWWGVWTQFSREMAFGTVWGRVEQGERFEQQDSILELGLERPFGDRTVGRLLGGGSPDVDWAPQWYLEGNARRQPEVTGWQWFLAELRHAEFVPRGVTTLRMGIDCDFTGGWRSILRSLHQEFQGGNLTDGWIVAVQRDYGNGWWWRAATSRAAESLTGQTVAGGVLVSLLWFAGVRSLMVESLGWRTDYELEEVKGGIDRHGISAGIFHTF